MGKSESMKGPPLQVFLLDIDIDFAGYQQAMEQAYEQAKTDGDYIRNLQAVFGKLRYNCDRFLAMLEELAKPDEPDEG